MQKPASTLTFLEGALEEFEAFLLSPEVFWKIWNGKPRGHGSQSLSLGMFLIKCNEIRSIETSLDSDNRTRWHDIQVALAKIRETWPVALKNKAATELPHRVNLWRSYLQDLEDGTRHPDSYPREIHNRLLITILHGETGAQTDLYQIESLLSTLDAKLKVLTRPGPFVWESPLQDVYPREDFWYLYQGLIRIDPH